MATAETQFRVLKGSKYLFDCAVAPADTLPTALRDCVVRASELDLLRGMDFSITKRLNLAQVDQMIACCRQHPPQALLTPASPEHTKAFEELAHYLKERERAGVGSLNAGVLVLLIPLPDQSDLMRCQLINTNTTVAEIGAQLSIPLHASASDAPDTGRGSGSTDTAPAPSKTSSDDAAPASTTNDTTTSLGDKSRPPPPLPLPPTKRQESFQDAGKDKYTKLRQEHAAFNAFYHHVLLQWSTKPSDAGQALEQLRHS